MGQLAGCTEQVTSIEEDYERMEKQGRHLKEVYESLEDALESETFKEASGEALIAEAERLHKKITNPYEFDRKTDV